MNIIIKCPEILELDEIKSFTLRLSLILQSPKVTINFSSIKYVFPFTTLILAESIKSFVEKRISKNRETIAILPQKKESDAISYLKYFGFFKHIGLDVGNSPNFDKGSNNYLPITTLTKPELMNENKDISLHEEIDKRSDRLAQNIFKDEKPEAQIMVSYCFREVIRNVFEHSHSDDCTFMAQSWYNGDVEIALIDNGIGIYKSLSTKHKLISVEEILKLAIKPGISSKLDNTSQSKWANTGFGLYVASNLGKKFGDFSLLSSSKLLEISKDSMTITSLDYNGTAIKLKININEAEYFPNVLNNIVKEGEQLIDSETGKVKKASQMSKIL